MKLRNTFSGSITLKQPWVIAALGCPLVFLIFKWMNFPDWWNIFHYIGVAALVAGMVLLLSKKFMNNKYTNILDWTSGLFLNWFAVVFIISQIARVR